MGDSQVEQNPGKSSHFSRSAIGRVSGIISRIFGSTRKLQATEQFLRRQLWAWPLIAAILFGGAGWWVHQSVEDAMRTQRATDLNAIVDASVTALNVWMGEQRINVQLFAEDEKLQSLVTELSAIPDGTPMTERNLLLAKPQELLRARLKHRLEICGYVGYLIVAPSGTVIAADQDAAVGKTLTGYRKEFFDQIVSDKTAVSKPFRSTLHLLDKKGELRANLPVMYAATPIRDKAGKPIASFGIRIRPEDQFTRILQVTQYGDSGETYAFDRNGLLLSQSRFDDLLKRIGLLADQPDSQSILTVEIRDPQVNMVAGERPTIRRSEQPLTKLAAGAVSGNPGYDADGYRGYRGVQRVGAWRWLKDYDFGVGTEVDAAEAFRPVIILRRAFWVLIVLLAVCAIGIFIAMLYIKHQQGNLMKATLAVKQLGQYSLEEKLGAGGMGTVYKARHAMLRRPTAVKLLDVEKMSDIAIARFEREVQLTSSLSHPNTVAIFDYGRTPDGIFYYAMEYLDGMNLEDLVDRFGPLPEARVVYLLKQICGSLSEAHARGLVHRDIKPANIYLTTRGGLHDFVKVLDFGLVKALEGETRANVTNVNAILGTPLYMSPEAVNEPDLVDARSDVYAVAAVGYFLLVGAPVFIGDSLMEICMKHCNAIPESPSKRAGKPISGDLEKLLLCSLAKKSSDRPADAAELLKELHSCALNNIWAENDAANWWTEHLQNERSVSSTQSTIVEFAATREMEISKNTIEYQENRVTIDESR